MKLRTILLLSLAVATIPCGATYAQTEPLASAVYAPKPDYPSLPNGHKPEGSGLFVFHINPKTGIVKYMSVEKSTGFEILDKTCIDRFKRWRFKPGPHTVKIPMTFTTHGAGYPIAPNQH